MYLCGSIDSGGGGLRGRWAGVPHFAVISRTGFELAKAGIGDEDEIGAMGPGVS
jgi:hypothetical protein